MAPQASVPYLCELLGHRKPQCCLALGGSSQTTSTTRRLFRNFDYQPEAQLWMPRVRCMILLEACKLAGAGISNEKPIRYGYLTLAGSTRVICMLSMIWTVDRSTWSKQAAAVRCQAVEQANTPTSNDQQYRRRCLCYQFKNVFSSPEKKVHRSSFAFTKAPQTALQPCKLEE